jgi:hypothetical protein
MKAAGLVHFAGDSEGDLDIDEKTHLGVEGRSGVVQVVPDTGLPGTGVGAS